MIVERERTFIVVRAGLDGRGSLGSGEKCIYLYSA